MEQIWKELIKEFAGLNNIEIIGRFEEMKLGKQGKLKH